MSTLNRLVFAVIALSMVCGVSAGDWSGFHGAERYGRQDGTRVPLEWSSSKNVMWKTAIPGRGHSSPIVSGDSVYVTTTYETSHFAYAVWNYAISAVAVLFAATGVAVAARNIKGGHIRGGKVLQHLRFLLFAQIFTFATVLALMGRHLLDFEAGDIRPWLSSTMLLMSCLMLVSLYVPLRSRGHLATVLLLLVFVAPIVVSFKQKEIPLGLDSVKGLMAAFALVGPAVFALGLLAAHLLSRRRSLAIEPDRVDAAQDGSKAWSLAAAGVVGVAVGLAPFVLLIYRAAGYQMPDSYVWDNRVKPDASWWWIGLCVLATLAAAAGLRKLLPSDGSRGLWLSKSSFILATVLATSYFVQANFVEEPDKFVRALVCLDAENGKIRWICEGLTGSASGRSRTVTHASATPVTDGRRVFCYFGEDGLMCVSREGRLLWKKSHPVFRDKFGVGTSPVLKNGVLVIVGDMSESERLPSAITAIDSATGEPQWERQRKSHEEFAAYGTPLVRSLNGQETVIVHGWHDVKAYHLETGRELWSYPLVHEGQHLVASLTCDNDRLYVSGLRQLIALDFSKLGTGGDPLVWSRSMEGEKSSTPVVASGMIFLVTEPGLAHCLDCRTGEVLWESRLPGRYYSSVIATAGGVFFTNESGQTTVAAADRRFQKIATNRLGESVYASLAPAGDRLLVRTIRHLYCL